MTKNLFDLYRIESSQIESVASILYYHVPLDNSSLKQTAQNVAELFLFCVERQSIWEKKNLGEVYASEIQIFNLYRFCNVYRELDRGTQYFHAQVNIIRREWRTGMSDIKKEDDGELLRKVLWASVVYRMINRVDTFLKFGKIPAVHERKLFYIFITKMMERGEKVFTGAHQTTNLKELGKSLKYIQKNLHRIEKMISRSGDLSEVHKALQCIPGISFFFWVADNL
mmetsp:Transcript_38355/g.89180  ORF Transcript_38355/g.89180 Transcript_38355/m.89180 type:complete len:226 (-) Transcript_38355:736-1413(-)